MDRPVLIGIMAHASSSPRLLRHTSPQSEGSGVPSLIRSTALYKHSQSSRRDDSVCDANRKRKTQQGRSVEIVVVGAAEWRPFFRVGSENRPQPARASWLKAR